jgi:pimeloyl-ACP methyl ester carboxylesterase
MRLTIPVLMAGMLAAAVAATWPVTSAAETEEERQKACAKPDLVERVVGKELCLAIRTFGADTAGPQPILVVVLHGDMSSGGPPDYHMAIAKGLFKAGIVAVGMIRPGYTDKDGRTSGGSTAKSDHYTAENVDAIADAVAKLKTHHKAAATVLIGHSGGAAISGVLIGRYPGIADRALLISCPCDIPRWRNMNHRSPWYSSLSPIEYADKVPTSARVIAITGDHDDNTDIELGGDYIAKLKKRGVAARFVAIPGAGHNINKKMRDAAEYAQALDDIVAAKP